MLNEIERDDFFLFATRRELIRLNIDYSYKHVPDVHFESSSENLLARTSSLKEVMAKRSSLYGDQMLESSDICTHKPRQHLFSRQNPNFLDCEPNVVNTSRLLQYKEYYELPDEVKLTLLDARAAWNPSSGMVAVYGLMLNCGVMLPLQPFVVRFFSDVNLAHLTPNGFS
ncbi:hypothetical protein ACOSP7_002420 [Xanthoceras sorbifolium]